MKKTIAILLTTLTLTLGATLSAPKAETTIKVERIITKTESNFKIEEGETGVIFTDGSWISANTLTNKYVFQAVELGDWSYELDSTEELEMIVKTYLENKNN